MPKLTDPTRDIAKLNRQLERLDQLERLQKQQDLRIAALRREQNKLREQRTVAGSNNLVFMWTDATATISWAAGFVRDHDGVHVHHVPAGSRAGLTAGTDYWAGWNPSHQTMSFEANLDTLQRVPNLVVICRIKTGNGADGTSGGGGTEPSTVGILNKEYLFIP
jgi:hypothetical protein